MSDRAVSARVEYERRRREESDIRRHLPRLHRAAHGTVLELGVRSGNSTAALLSGVEEHGGSVWSVDVDPLSAEVFADHPQWHFVCTSSLDRAAVRAAGLGESIDLLFVDTLHTFEHVKAELGTWASSVVPGGRIFIHDAEAFPGVWEAARQFAREQGLPCERFYRSSGLAALYPGGSVWTRLRIAIRQPLADALAQIRRIGRGMRRALDGRRR